jgi:hypothetical protein
MHSSKKHLDVNSKPFINAFTGRASNRIIWTGLTGDLKIFINYSIQAGLIEKNSSKWLITANIFTLKGIQFGRREISAQKSTSNKLAIESIINSINNSTLQ